MTVIAFRQLTRGPDAAWQKEYIKKKKMLVRKFLAVLGIRSSVTVHNFLKIQLNIILPSTSRSIKCSLALHYTSQVCVSRCLTLPPQ